MATKKTTTSTRVKSTRKVPFEDIQKRAQEIYLERLKSNKPGDELSDWVQAEKDLAVK